MNLRDAAQYGTDLRCSQISGDVAGIVVVAMVSLRRWS
ncbi:hypothetical protein BAL199_22762 [alpha proteobacterium BAL199]|nr:hypothetical protein BAL199_22762 [alpha proteobacterium BAL199]